MRLYGLLVLVIVDLELFGLATLAVVVGLGEIDSYKPFVLLVVVVLAL